MSGGLLGGMFGKGGDTPLRGERPPDGPNLEDLRLHYETLAGLFKHYLELLVKFNVLFYAITGAILSYYLTHIEIRIARFALLLPAIVALMFALLFVYGIILLEYWRNDLFWIRDQLKLKSILEVRVLSLFLFISSVLLFIVAVGLLVLVFFPNIIPSAIGSAV